MIAESGVYHKSDGATYCRACTLESNKIHRSVPEFNERRRARMHAMTLEQRRIYVKWDSDKAADKLLRRDYGITLVHYNVMFAQQRGLCAACGQSETVKHNGRIRRLSVDHDHTTGLVRGLLCHNCNRAVGLLGDNAERAAALAQYLTRRGLQAVG